MGMRRAWRGCVGLLLLGAAGLPASAQSAPPDSPQAKSIVALVEKAAALVDAKGKAAFTDFRRKGSEWFDGETYLFAYDMKGNVLLNPAFPKREGTNVIGQTDANGKKFHDAIIRLPRAGLGMGRLHVPAPSVRRRRRTSGRT